MMIIRPIEERDYDKVLNIYRPFIENSPVTFEISIPSPTLWRERIENITKIYPWLVCEINDRVAGYSYACRHRDREAYQWNAEVSLYLHPAFYRRRVGTALYTSLFSILKIQGITNLLAGITLPNPQSEGFHSAMGFNPVGIYRNIGFKAGKWYDVGWYEKSISPPGISPPSHVIPFPSLQQKDLDPALKEGIRFIKTDN